MPGQFGDQEESKDDEPELPKMIAAIGPPKIMPKAGMISFALLSRKGKYTKLDKIELPELSSVVIQTR